MIRALTVGSRPAQSLKEENMQITFASLRAYSGSALAVALVAGLSACGGGGSEDPAAPSMQIESVNSPSKQRLYSVKDLGTLCTTLLCGIGVSAVNDKGEIAGYTYTQSFQHAMVSSGGTLKDIGGFPPGGWGAATSINDRGQVAGWSTVQGDEAVPGYAFLYDGGALQNLGALGGNFSAATGINNRGQITGSAALADGTNHAFLYSGGTMQDIGTLGGRLASGSAVNDRGHVAGFSYLAGNVSEPHAFLYRHGVLKDLGTLGGGSSSAAAINDHDAVVGFSTLTAGATLRHAFLHRHHQMHDLGTLPGGSDSFAVGISNDGDVIGSSDGLPFVYRHGVMRNVNELLDASGAGWVIDEVNGISPDEGLITGRGRINGEGHAFVLTPTRKKDRH
jgi:probable HAF family extracellular repeat protein